MSRLDELIDVLCPDGVEYKPFGEIATIFRGASPRPIKNFITGSQDGISWIKIGDIKTGNKYVEETKEKITEEGAKKSRFVKKGDFILSNSMSFGRPYILNIDGCIHDGWLSISDFENDFTSDFLYHLLSSHKLQEEMRKRASYGGAVQNLNADIVKALVLPIPPLPAQEEIVRILDNFAELTTELNENLTAELTARKKQYEYYRDNLLTFGDEVEWKPLEQICINCDRYRKPVTKSVRQAGEYPYYGASGIVDYVSEYIFDGDYLLVSEDGANLIARSTPIAFSISGKNWVNNHAHVLQFDTCEMRRFVEIYLNAIDLNRYISTAAQPKLTQDNLNKIPVPVPDFEQVKHIAGILDRFDALCNDIREGLSAENKARKQQYEYYRDKLLTFTEKEVCVDE